MHTRAPTSVARWLLAAVATATIFTPGAATAEDPTIERELESIQEDLAADDAPDAPPSPDASSTDTTGGDGSALESQLDELEAEVDQKTDHGHTHDTAPPPPEPDDASSDGAIATAWNLYRDPVLCALMAGAVLGLLGVYVVSRRIVFVSAALSQVSALGITLGFLVAAFAGLGGLLQQLLPPALAIVLSMIVVFVLTAVGDHPSYPRDAVLGTAFVVPMALVLVVGPYIPQEMHEIETILHGSAVVVRTADLWAIGLAGAAVVATQLFALRAFVFASLDPTVARTQGLPVGALDAVLFGSIALMTGLVTRALGALPTFALTVLPAIGALSLKIGLGRVFAVASLLGATAGAGGYWVAYQLDWSVGASQTLVAAALMLATRGVGSLNTLTD